jgi:hypothetical protein
MATGNVPIERTSSVGGGISIEEEIFRSDTAGGTDERGGNDPRR